MGFCCALEGRSRSWGMAHPGQHVWGSHRGVLHLSNSGGSSSVGWSPTPPSPPIPSTPRHRAVRSVTPNAAVIAGFASWQQEVGGSSLSAWRSFIRQGGPELLPEYSTPRCYVPNSSPGTRGNTFTEFLQQCNRPGNAGKAAGGPEHSREVKTGAAAWLHHWRFRADPLSRLCLWCWLVSP